MANWRRIIETAIKDSSSKILWDEPLYPYTTFRIGGKAECFIIVTNIEDLKTIIKISRESNIPIYVIGNGSNLLISDQGLNGITIKLGLEFSYVFMNSNQITIGAATKLSTLIDYCTAHSLEGLEFLWGIPATFGGAVISNAGAFKQDIGSKIISIKGVNINGNEITIQKEQLQFSYRKSNIPDSFIVLEGCINLAVLPEIDIRKKLAEYKRIRLENQPRGFSAGSVFKNPLSLAAGKLIDDCKLKGLKRKGAYISKKHGNFIINRHNANFSDVYELIQNIKSNVELKKGIVLQEEIQILPKNQEVKKWQNQEKL